MPVTYEDITFIQDGQAITAAVLNAPSVDLETRTIELKRDSDQVHYREAHTGECEVALVSDDPDNASIGVRSQLKNDGNSPANLVRYFLPEFNNISFSIYSKAAHGGRFIIPGSSVGSVFSDSINGSNNILSTALSVPGDGIYAKIPLRYTGEVEDSLIFPDLAYPRSRTQSTGSQYLTEALYSPSLVKLPAITRMDLLSSDTTEDIAAFTSRLTAQFPNHIDSLQVDAQGALKILDSNGDTLTLQVGGTVEGATCEVTHLLPRQDSSGGLVVAFSKATAPIYVANESSRVSVVDLKARLLRAGVLLSESLLPFAEGNYLGYHLLPEILDPDFDYIPLVRLTENSLLVGDRLIPLSTRHLSNGEVLNFHGHPASEIPSTAVEGTNEYNLSVLGSGDTDKAYKGVHTVVVGNTELVTDNGSTYLSVTSSSGELSKLLKRNLTAGDIVTLLSVRAIPLSVCNSSVGNMNTVACSAWISLPVGTASLSSTIEVSTPQNSFDLGNRVELLPDTDNRYAYTSADEQSSNGIAFNFKLEETQAGNNMLAGNVYVEFDLSIV